MPTPCPNCNYHNEHPTGAAIVEKDEQGVESTKVSTCARCNYAKTAEQYQADITEALSPIGDSAEVPAAAEEVSAATGPPHHQWVLEAGDAVKHETGDAVKHDDDNLQHLG